MSFYDAIQIFPEQPINKQLLLDVLKDYKRPYDKIDELVKKSLLIQRKRELYIPGPKLNIAVPEPFLNDQQLDKQSAKANQPATHQFF